MKNRYPLEPLLDRVLSPFENFIQHSSAGGVVLIAATAIALAIANSSWSASFHDFWLQPFGLFYGRDFRLQLPVREWVNEALMALFFLRVGLELKREVLVGELSTLRDAVLPIAAAAGGMAVPALIYVFINGAGDGAHGWGIPTATDIAFAIGILVLLGDRVPRGLVVFLAALAIADDLGAVLLIAVFYSHGFNGAALAIVAALMGVLLLLNRSGVRALLPYAVVGILMWHAVLLSGIHSTLAGILLALCIPAKPRQTPSEFDRRLLHLHGNFREQTTGEKYGPLANQGMADTAAAVEKAAVRVQSPLQHIEDRLNPWVAFVVIPLFALANAAIDFRGLDIMASLRAPIALGIATGLVAGKFIGISLLSWIAIRTGLGRLPQGVVWSHLLGAAWLGGIGFTMSLFIAQLAFGDDTRVQTAKIGILLASLIAASIGTVWLLVATRRRRPAD